MLLKTKSLLLGALAVALLGLGACSQATVLGLSLVSQDQVDVVQTDTFTMELSTEAIDSVLTSGRSLYYCGSMTDPVFGRTESSMYFNFRLPTTGVRFTGATLDSVVLTLSYDGAGHLGNYLAAQTWEVVRLEEDLETDSLYYSNKNFVLGDVVNAGYTFVPRYNRNTYVIDTSGNDTLLLPQVRIPLDNALGDFFLNADSSNYLNTSNFQTFFKGLAVRPVGNSNSALVRLNLNSFNSRLLLYYHQSGRKRVYEFLLNGATSKTMKVTHDYTGTPVLQNNNTDTVAYLQGLAGTRIKVAFPTAASLDNVIINHAELSFDATSDARDQFFPLPSNLFCSYRNEDGKLLLIDEVLAGTSFFGGGIGVYQNGGRNNFGRRYTINISKQFQRIVDNTTPENALYIDVASSIETPNHVVFGNQRGTGHRPKLKVIYTKFPNQ